MVIEIVARVRRALGRLRDGHRRSNVGKRHRHRQRGGRQQTLRDVFLLARRQEGPIDYRLITR